MPGSGPHYQVAATSTAVARLDTDSGEIIACDASHCTRLTEPDRAKTLRLFNGSAARQQPALPPPAKAN
jgi:hypothetical protein